MDSHLDIGPKARTTNPALAPLAFLLDAWHTTGTHSELTGQTLTGRTSFAEHEGGAFIVMRTEVDHPAIPDGVALIGSDDGAGRLSMIYFDERGVSRIFAVTLGERSITWRRDDPKFAQSVTITAGDDGRLTSAGRMAQDGGPWSEDLSQAFEREETLE